MRSRTRMTERLATRIAFSLLVELVEERLGESQSPILILLRISSTVARISMKRLSLAERTTRTPSSEEESEDPAWRYLDGPASESEEELEELELEDPELEDPELELVSESDPELSSPPQNLEACAMGTEVVGGERSASERENRLERSLRGSEADRARWRAPDVRRRVALDNATAAR